jgi:glyoxylase-like metal-dependent hydrolase (beta-lactamase superfamily II)
MLPVSADLHLADGDVLTVGTVAIHVVHTPGHTPGGVCFLIDDVLLSGDTLFPGGPGNTRTSLGSFPTIIESVRRLFALPAATRVMPGHGRDTTIGDELPHLDDWIARGW